MSRRIRDYSYNGLAGCVMQQRNRSTGFLVGIYVGDQAGMESDPATPWVTVCEEHHTLVCHRTLDDARGFAADPKIWCEDCRMGYLFNRVQGGYLYVEGQGEVMGLVASREEATVISEDAPIRERAEIAGFPKWQYDFVRATHADMERTRRTSM